MIWPDLENCLGVLVIVAFVRVIQLLVEQMENPYDDDEFD